MSIGWGGNVGGLHLWERGGGERAARWKKSVRSGNSLAIPHIPTLVMELCPHQRLRVALFHVPVRVAGQEGGPAVLRAGSGADGPGHFRTRCSRVQPQALPWKPGAQEEGGFPSVALLRAVRTPTYTTPIL